jgi:hypothetical protein
LICSQKQNLNFSRMENNKDHWAKFSLKSRHWLSYSRYYSPFYEIQRFITAFITIRHSPYPESHIFSPYSPNLFL